MFVIWTAADGLTALKWRFITLTGGTGLGGSTSPVTVFHPKQRTSNFRVADDRDGKLYLGPFLAAASETGRNRTPARLNHDRRIAIRATTRNKACKPASTQNIHRLHPDDVVSIRTSASAVRKVLSLGELSDFRKVKLNNFGRSCSQILETWSVCMTSAASFPWRSRFAMIFMGRSMWQKKALYPAQR